MWISSNVSKQSSKAKKSLLTRACNVSISTRSFYFNDRIKDFGINSSSYFGMLSFLNKDTVQTFIAAIKVGSLVL